MPAARSATQHKLCTCESHIRAYLQVHRVRGSSLEFWTTHRMAAKLRMFERFRTPIQLVDIGHTELFSAPGEIQRRMAQVGCKVGCVIQIAFLKSIFCLGMLKRARTR